MWVWRRLLIVCIWLWWADDFGLDGADTPVNPFRVCPYISMRISVYWCCTVPSVPQLLHCLFTLCFLSVSATMAYPVIFSSSRLRMSSGAHTLLDKTNKWSLLTSLVACLMAHAEVGVISSYLKVFSCGGDAVGAQFSLKKLSQNVPHPHFVHDRDGRLAPKCWSHGGLVFLRAYFWFGPDCIWNSYISRRKF